MYAVVQIGSSTRRSDCAIKRSVFLSDAAARAGAWGTAAASAVAAAVLPKSRRVGRCRMGDLLCSSVVGAKHSKNCAHAHMTPRWGINSNLSDDLLMQLADFDFDLPRELIADRPAEPRDSARLLVIPEAGEFADRHIGDLPELLRPGDLLVFNDTKVIPARLVGRRGEATVEITLARDLGGGMWRAYAKGARRLRPGDHIDFAPDFAAEVDGKTPEGEVTLRFDREGAPFRDA